MIKLYMSKLSIYLWMTTPDGKVYCGYADGTWTLETWPPKLTSADYDLVGKL